ncbi:SusC/RagA family TonB-linked outer membrane protein [Mucilaginibacter sp. PPCGB 2223]|uniref:SusC/RagA family TonB-linked outer membrane protein n=1 Tax=Mucilaginibacter sp. PPCGB 2223 TaxID=1886027 RepID=UPI0008248170|nr:SusC/RagA family TonB-linked outer membrane protein [Mucilaginibacter sp. PPCGB 2223]OCX52060.1 SusC/RagA family TonB-linked outer membrane protein [Mucilaginibacter sp. PPCGB 2223]
MTQNFTFYDRYFKRHLSFNKSPIQKLSLCLFIILLSAFLVKAQAQTVSLSVKNTPLKTVFKSITKQTGFVFFYNYSILEKSKPVTIDLNKVTLKQALDACFENQPFTYAIQGKQVTVIARPSQKITVDPRLNILVKGFVKDSSGAPLPAITVLVRGTTQYTTTDKDGKFNISAPIRSFLVFSSINYNAKEVIVDDKSNDLVITLTRRVIHLGDVQVISTGYQDLRSSNIAGAVSSIKASALYFDGTNTLEQALQGKLPGVVVTNQSGQVGTRQKVRVRGTSTLLGSQEPIWVVDGVIQEDPLPFKATVLSTTLGNAGNATKDNFDYIRDYVGSSIGWLNPNDIDEITVLKDASATAIYGVRAANGVIVITTKKGQVGPPVITYGITVNTSERVTYDRLNLMNSQERIGVSEEIYNRGLVGGTNLNTSVGFAGALNDYLFGRITYTQFNAQVKYLETLNTDWFNILFRTPLSVSQNVSISGGNANTRYYGSFGYNSTNGTAIGNDLSGFTGSFGISTQVNSKLYISAKLSASSRTTDGFYLTDPYSYASKTSRVIPAYDQSDNLFYYANSAGRQYNIINELNNSGSSNKQQAFNANVSARYDIIKGLTLQSLYSLNNSSTSGNTYATEKTSYIAGIRNYDYGTVKPTDFAYLNSKLPIGGEYNADDNQNLSWNWRNSLSYTKTIHNKHVFTALIGEEFNSSHYTGMSATTYGYLRDRGLTFAIVPSQISTSATTKAANTLVDAQIHNKTDRTANNVGVYATLNYSYDNRYVLNFSVRNDRSNRFGQYTEEKFNPVLAGGLRWNIANEKWFEHTDWLSGLSMRASWGYQRNVVTNVSPDLILKIPTSPAAAVTDQFTGDYLLTVGSLPYADLRFEKTISTNLGFDMSLFQNKVQASIDYYQKTARDLVTYLSVPAEYGVASMPINGGSLTNRGFEVSAGFTPVRTRDFTWTVSLNTAKNFSDLVKSGFQVNATWRTAASGAFNKEGYPVSGLWAFDFTGINPANGYPTINLQVAANGTPVTDPTSYMKYVGKADPDFTGGIGMNFRYKKLTLGSNFNLQVGGKKFLAPLYSLTNGVPSEFDNLSRSILNRWTPANTTATIPGLPDATVGNGILLPDGKTYTNVYEMYSYSTARVVNASELRCNSINLSYSLPDKIVTALRCKSIRAGAGVSQPFAIVSKDFNGVDPEVAAGGQPRVRSYSLNVNVSF